MRGKDKTSWVVMPDLVKYSHSQMYETHMRFVPATSLPTSTSLHHPILPCCSYTTVHASLLVPSVFTAVLLYVSSVKATLQQCYSSCLFTAFSMISSQHYLQHDKHQRQNKFPWILLIN